MNRLITASAVMLLSLAATGAAWAGDNAGSMTPQPPQAPSTPAPQGPAQSPENSNGALPKPGQSPNAMPGGSAASGDSSGTTGISGPYNPTPPGANSGSAAQ
ncbi:MAG TPA: hypothetical protein VM620_13635 [Hyphomicrobium sp.]|jgi:hypothetical protein|nr:hypothetical protein [Hyphomicrobium sp.]